MAGDYTKPLACQNSIARPNARMSPTVDGAILVIV
jgi:hypothetical protein